MRTPTPFGKYLLLERISVGGMAEVFKAKLAEGDPARLFAIKRILPSMAEDADFIQMFIDEARIAGQLHHSNIAQIFELGRVEDAHFIAMEYVWGKDLLQIQNRFRRTKSTMPFPMAAAVAARMCDALDYAHKKLGSDGKPLNIIHRDVSPQNVLMSYEGELKVIDFGIAKAASRSTKTQAGVLKGKFGYMSPEQVSGQPIDRRSDIFAIGTILYELLTAERLFVGESDFATLEKVRNVDVPPPTVPCPGCPAELERIILKGIAKDTGVRYQWAAEMKADLEAFLATLPEAFEAKHLATWMHQHFSVEWKRESQLLEEQLRAAVDPGPRKTLGPVAPIPTLSGPLRGVLASRTSPAARGAEFQDQETLLADDVKEDVAAAALGDAASDFHAEATVITGGPGAPSLGLEMGAANGVAELAGESTRILAPDGPDGQVGHGAPGGHGGGAEPTDMPGQATAILDVVNPHDLPGGSTGTFAGQMLQGSPHDGHPSTSQVPMPVLAPPRASTLGKDVVIGLCVAGALVGSVLGGRALLGRSQPRGTLVVTVSATSPVRVLLDGKERGRVGGADKALALKGVALGEHRLRVVGESGSEEETVSLTTPDDVKIVNVALAEEHPAPTAVVATVTQLAAGATSPTLPTTPITDAPRPAATPTTAPPTSPTPPPTTPVAAHPTTAPATPAATPTTDHPTTAPTAPTAPAPPSTHPTSPAPAEAQGRLSVKTDPPGAEVHVNGKPVGVSPVEVRDVTLTRAVRVTIRKHGYKPVVKSLSFESNHDQVLDLVLVAAPDEPAPPPPAPKNTPSAGDKSAAKTDKGAAPTAAAAGNGYLVANSQPWAKVLIDGHDTGKMTPIAPHSKIPLKAGKHVVTFAVNGKKWNFDVEIKPGQDFKLIKTLTE